MPLSSLSENVSTHSRLKAAEIKLLDGGKRLGSFNTQPPEGGCTKRQNLFVDL